MESRGTLTSAWLLIVLLFVACVCTLLQGVDGAKPGLFETTKNKAGIKSDNNLAVRRLFMAVLQSGTIRLPGNTVTSDVEARIVPIEDFVGPVALAEGLYGPFQKGGLFAPQKVYEIYNIHAGSHAMFMFAIESRISDSLPVHANRTQNITFHGTATLDEATGKIRGMHLYAINFDDALQAWPSDANDYATRICDTIFDKCAHPQALFPVSDNCVNSL
jgi:hypothetical protein